MLGTATALAGAVVISWLVAPAAALGQERTVEEVKREITRRAASRTPQFDNVRAD